MALLRYRGPLAEATGTGEEQVPAATVKEALAHIRAAHGAAAYKEAKAMLIAVDGVSIQLLQKYSTPLHSGALVSFLPVCGGG